MYAKRQFTWFKRERDILWFDITGREDYEEIAREILKEIMPKISFNF